MADKKAATAAAQTQSDKPKKNDAKKVSFFGKVKNFFKGIGKYFKDTKSDDHRYRGRADRGGRADRAGSHLWRRHSPVDRRLSALSGGKDHG